MTPDVPRDAALLQGLLDPVLAELFPFHLLVDAGGTAVRVGPSLRLVLPGLSPGTPVGDHLTITTPRGAVWAGAAHDRHSGLVLVSAVQGPLLLRGQVLRAGDGVLFLGSPWVTALPQLAALGLRLSDFAAADPVTDLLLLLGAQSNALADAQELAAQLEAASAQRTLEAERDPLTGLPNRVRITALMRERIAAARDTGGGLAVVMLDLDRFREINDTLGHDCGDRLLAQVGPRLQAVLRDGETVARLGGDEFALLVPSRQRGPGSLADALAVARRVVDAIREPFVVDDLGLLVEASAGVATWPEHGPTPEALLQHVETAMYVAKSRHQEVAAYEPALDVTDPRRLTLLAELRTAVDEDGLVLHYQPLLDLRSGRVEGVEALVRWQHPDEGLLPPSEFVDLAESSGLIHSLTRAVLGQAIGQALVWQRAGRPLCVSVNISARCLMDLTLPDVVADLLRTGLPARLLTLEITESALILDPERARTVLDRLCELGVGLSVDDFGTGYTSLSHLRDLPVRELKIDRSFVTDMLRSPRDAVIVRAGVELAARLGMVSVAEGVEDAETLAALADLGCTTAQGYHLSRPLPVAELERWLAARRAVASSAA